MASYYYNVKKNQAKKIVTSDDNNDVKVFLNFNEKVEGYLFKTIKTKGKKTKWIKRWFSLNVNKKALLYYEYDDDTNELGEIKLSAIKDITPHEDNEHNNKNFPEGEQQWVFLIHLKDGSRVYHLMSTEKSKMWYWISYLQTAISSIIAASMVSVSESNLLRSLTIPSNNNNSNNNNNNNISHHKSKNPSSSKIDIPTSASSTTKITPSRTRSSSYSPSQSPSSPSSSALQIPKSTIHNHHHNNNNKHSFWKKTKTNNESSNNNSSNNGDSRMATSYHSHDRDMFRSTPSLVNKHKSSSNLLSIIRGDDNDDDNDDHYRISHSTRLKTNDFVDFEEDEENEEEEDGRHEYRDYTPSNDLYNSDIQLHALNAQVEDEVMSIKLLQSHNQHQHHHHLHRQFEEFTNLKNEQINELNQQIHDYQHLLNSIVLQLNFYESKSNSSLYPLLHQHDDDDDQITVGGDDNDEDIRVVQPHTNQGGNDVTEDNELCMKIDQESGLHLLTTSAINQISMIHKLANEIYHVQTQLQDNHHSCHLLESENQSLRVKLLSSSSNSSKNDSISSPPPSSSRLHISHSEPIVNPKLYSSTDSHIIIMQPKVNVDLRIHHSDDNIVVHEPQPSSSLSSSTSSIRKLKRWEDDAVVSKCRYCSAEFTFIRRKHHCRLCGNVVCGSCSRRTIRVCELCYAFNTNRRPNL